MALFSAGFLQDVQHGMGVEEWEGGSRYDGQRLGSRGLHMSRRLKEILKTSSLRFNWGKKQGYGRAAQGFLQRSKKLKSYINISLTYKI